MTTEEDLVVELLASVENDLPVNHESRARTRSSVLATFDEVSAEGITHRPEPREDIPDLVAVKPPGFGAERARRSYMLMAAAVVVIAGMGIALSLREFSQPDNVSITAVDQEDREGDTPDQPSVNGSDLIEGLEFELPPGVELAGSSPGQMMFVDTSAGGEVPITAVRVRSWGEALAVDNVPSPGEVSSLRDFLAKSSTDQSELGLVEVNADGVRIEAWRVRLTRAAAAAVGCEPVGPCGVVVNGPEGQTVELSAGNVTELISVEFGTSTLIVVASYAEEEATDELVAVELARSIALGN